jgi:YD repeat-containing protein
MSEHYSGNGARRGFPAVARLIIVCNLAAVVAGTAADNRTRVVGQPALGNHINLPIAIARATLDGVSVPTAVSPTPSATATQSVISPTRSTPSTSATPFVVPTMTPLPRTNEGPLQNCRVTQTRDGPLDGIIDTTTISRYNAHGDIAEADFESHVGIVERIKSRWEYNEQYQLVRRIDDNGNNGTIDNTHTFSYDDMGRLARWEVDSDMDGRLDIINTYSYDDLGRLIRVLKLRDNGATVGSIESYVYGEAGELLQTTIDLSGDGTLNQNIHYEWKDGSLWWTREYNTSGAPTSFSQYFRLPDGRISGVDIDRPADGTVDIQNRYYYNERDFYNRYERMRGREQDIITYEYDDVGRLALEQGVFTTSSWEERSSYECPQ